MQITVAMTSGRHLAKIVPLCRDTAHRPRLPVYDVRLKKRKRMWAALEE